MLFIPFYLQNVLRLSTLDSGLILSAYPISMGIVAPISGWLSDRISYRPLGVAGMIITAAAMLLLTTLNQTSSVLEVIILVQVPHLRGRPSGPHSEEGQASLREAAHDADCAVREGHGES